MNWYLQVLSKYAVFDGRAPRQEFWYFLLINFIVVAILSLLDSFMGTYHSQSQIGLFSGVYTLAVFLPNLAVSVRRLHDSGRTGWWALLYLIPFFGFLILLIFMMFDSEPGTNEYGPSPKI